MKNKMIVAAVLCAVISCSNVPSLTIQKLPSGKEIKVIGMGQVFTKNDKSIVLKYQTDINLDDKKLLRNEVEEIWEVFKISADNKGFSSAIITALAPPKGFVITVNKSISYVFNKSPDGTWHMQGP